MYIGIYLLIGVFFLLMFFTKERTDILKNLMVEKGFPPEQHKILMFVMYVFTVLSWPWTLIRGVYNLSKGKSFFYGKVDGVEYN
jgi:hypothetical protein